MIPTFIVMQSNIEPTKVAILEAVFTFCPAVGTAFLVALEDAAADNTITTRYVDLRVLDAWLALPKVHMIILCECDATIFNDVVVATKMKNLDASDRTAIFDECTKRHKEFERQMQSRIVTPQSQRMRQPFKG